MITKRIVIDLIQILENGVLQIREATIIEEDGVELSRTFHRHVKCPDTVDMTDQDQRVQGVADTVWTPAVKQSYIKEQSKRKKL